MSVLGLKDKALVVRLKEKQLSASRWRSCRQTEIYCVRAAAWRENSVMGDVFKPRDPTVLLLEQWMAGRQRDGTGRDGLNGNTGAVFLETELLLRRLVQGQECGGEAGFDLSIKRVCESVWQSLSECVSARPSIHYPAPWAYKLST